MRVQGKSINDLLATHRVQRTLLKDMSSAGTLCVWREFEDLTNDWALVGKHTLKQCIPDAQRKPQKANITEGVLKSRFWNIDLYRVLPILQFILEQAVSNPLPTVSSVCSGLQLRSVMHQCGESSGSEVRRSASGAGMSSSAFSICWFFLPAQSAGIILHKCPSLMYNYKKCNNTKNNEFIAKKIKFAFLSLPNPYPQ